MSSSSVWMTRTATVPDEAEMRPSPYRVTLLLEFDPEKAQPSADPGANRWRVLPMPPANTRVSSPPRAAGECADLFLDLVTEQLDRLSRPNVLACRRTSRTCVTYST